jgi:hypothetical protein
MIRASLTLAAIEKRSFALQGLGMIVEDIADTLLRLLDLHRIGAAMEYVWESAARPGRP